MTPSLITRIRRFNQDREPERLGIKYATMRRDPFAFFRGTAHLFHADWPKHSPLDSTPLTWVSGDLHLENFGSFKGSNGLAYFDLNDFDEATLAPASRDLVRFGVSIVLATRAMRLPAAETRSFISQVHLAYTHALRVGKAMWVERATARGLVKQLLRAVKDRTRADLLDRRTIRTGDRRRLKIDGVHALALAPDRKAALARVVKRATVCQADPVFFRVIDVARRVAGTGSLGLRRYTVLVNGHGGRNGNALLDIKEAAPSSLMPDGVRQPEWSSQADRVVSIQRRVQAVSPALLHAVRIGHRSYILRELQPIEDRLALDAPNEKRRRLCAALQVMAEVISSGHLRSSSREGSATADEWIAFGHDRGWSRPMSEYAHHYADIVEAYWREFAQAYDDRAFGAIEGKGQRVEGRG